MPCDSNKESCDNRIMFRGKSKRTPEPSSEYSLNTIKNSDTNSTFRSNDDCDQRTTNFDTNDIKTCHESSQLIPKHLGYVSLI